MPDGATLLLFIGTSLALLAVPGPAVIYVVTRSLDQGRGAGMVSMLGVETGTFAYALFFLAFLPQFVDRSRGAITVQILVLGSLFTLLAILSDGAYVLLAGAVGSWLRAGRRARRGLARLSGGVYIGLGVSAALAGSGHSRAGS
jgi:threonine/homoserine/homoserine lactone efflux protein